MKKQDCSWNKEEIELLRWFHPSIEELVGNTQFPPNEESVEKFIDSFSNYGFHCFDLRDWDGLDEHGLKYKHYSNNYFIADRIVSYKPHSQPNQIRKKISASEYFSRFHQSIIEGDKRATNSSWELEAGLLVINRKKALIIEGIDITEDWKEKNEHRGIGFLGDTEGPVLDEGALNIRRGYINRDAIIDHFKLWEGKHPIVQFYELVMQGFLKN